VFKPAACCLSPSLRRLRVVRARTDCSFGTSCRYVARCNQPWPATEVSTFHIVLCRPFYTQPFRQ